MIENIADVSLVVQLLSLIILVSTTLTLVIAMFSYVGYKLRQRVPMTDNAEKPVFFVRYEPRLGLHPAQPTAGTPMLVQRGYTPDTD